MSANDPRQPERPAPATRIATGDVDHYVVGPSGLRAAVHVLEQLPYGQVAQTMKLLEQSTTPVYTSEVVRELKDHEQKLLELADAVSNAVHNLDIRIDSRSRRGLSLRSIANLLAVAHKAATHLDVPRYLNSNHVEPAKKE